MTRRALTWVVAAVFVVAAARQVAYALAADSAARRLAGAGGGTDPLWVAAVALVGAAAVSVVGLWLVATGVRERCELELHRWSAPPPLRLRRVGRDAVALAAGTNAAFAAVESVVHYRHGLGWHGVHCLAGPVHADAAPILVGLSLLTAAVVAAADHLFAAIRRVVAVWVLRHRVRPGPAAARVPIRGGREAPGPRPGRANLTRGPPQTA